MPIDYDNAMGRIIAVNLAHWRKDQQKRTKQSQNKREYQENVQEIIETTNEGAVERYCFCCMFCGVVLNEALSFKTQHFVRRRSFKKITDRCNLMIS